MNELSRLSEDETHSLEKQLLNAGRAYRASSQTRARTAAAIGIGVGVGSALFAGKAAASTSASVAKITAIGLLATGASFVAYRSFVPNDAGADLVLSARQPASLSTARSTVSQPEEPARAEPSVSEPAQAEPAQAEPAQAEPAAAEPTSASPAPAVRSNTTSSNALSAELARLDSARKKLGSGRAAAAIDDLDAYGREFPRGILRLEASVLRIEALAKAGRTGEARERAKRFLAAHPNSVLGARVKRYAGE